MNKRTFLKSSAILGAGAMVSFPAISKMVNSVAHLPVEEVAKDDDFWTSIRGNYKLKPDYINLENGYYCIQPQEVLEKYIEHIKEINLQGAYYMRTVQFENKKKAADKVAELVGCAPECTILTRNTTELRVQVVCSYFNNFHSRILMSKTISE